MTTSSKTFWATVKYEGSTGKITAYIPGLAQATRATKDEAYLAVLNQLQAKGWVKESFPDSDRIELYR